MEDFKPNNPPTGHTLPTTTGSHPSAIWPHCSHPPQAALTPLMSQAYEGLCSFCFLPPALQPTKVLFTNNFQIPAVGFTCEFAFKTLCSSFTFSKVNTPGQGFLTTPLNWAINSLRTGNWSYFSVTSRVLGQDKTKPHLTILTA